MAREKLVRDRIPEIIISEGRKPATRIAGTEEYRRKLSEKLEEEVAEFLANMSTEEMADVLEVLHAICELEGIRMEDVERARLVKKKERGGFSGRVILQQA